jgi:uncharacterized RDD family membrane protein YckC
VRDDSPVSSAAGSRSRADSPAGAASLPRHGPHSGARPAGLPRRLAAVAYDALLLVALAMLLTGALLVFTHGEAIAPGNLPYRLALLALGIGYFTWFWRKSGQTPGMRAWRVRVVRSDGGALRTRDALLRAVTALVSWLALGLGFLWAAFDRAKLAWHDRLSRTRLVRVEPSAYPRERDADDEGEDADGEPADEHGRQVEDGAARGHRLGADVVDDAEQHADHQALPGTGAAQRPEDER